MKKTSITALLLSFVFTSNFFAQGTWTLQTSPVMADFYSACAVNPGVCWICGASGIVVRTTNGGTTWTRQDAGLVGNDFYSIFALDALNCWVGAGDGGLWHTTNGGTNWSFVTLTPASVFINVVHFFDANYGFVQGDPVAGQWRYYITSNGGANWILPPNAPPSTGNEAGWNNSYTALDTGHIWWGTNVSKIWKGSFRGQFIPLNVGTSQYPNTFGLSFNDEIHGLVATAGSSGPGPVILTTNGGFNWVIGTFIPSAPAIGLKSVPGTAYVWMSCGASSTGIIYRSTNYGFSFTSQFTSLYQAYCISMADINCGWCGAASGRIYKYTDNVGIGEPITTPTKFELGQNYPNPFNPQTTIDFSLAQAGYITLKVYNLLGQEVMTLIDGVETAGNHTTIFNASNLPSGAYFYTMKSGDFTDTKSLMLIK
jgi:hypothetical protein